MLSSLNFTGVLLIGFGGLLVAMAVSICAVSLLHKRLAEKLESWICGGWSVIDAWPNDDVFKCAITWLDHFINKAVSKMILDYERSPIFGAIATTIFIVILPLAALANTLQGGSPFMLYCYGFICLGVVYQLFTAEIRFNAAIRSAMAGISAFLLVFALPYYAAWSLTEYLMNQSILLSVVASVLVANVLYAGTAGLGALVRTGNRTGELPDLERFLAYLLFAIPVFYVLYWFIVFAGSVAYDDIYQMHDLRSLLVSVGCGSLSFALIKLLVDRIIDQTMIGLRLARILGVIVILIVSSLVIFYGSYEVGTFHSETARQWLAHIPVVPAFAIAVMLGTAMIGHLVCLSHGFSQRINKHPLLATNLLIGSIGGLVMLVGIGIR